jgi:cation diffusion facilitator family transporter
MSTGGGGKAIAAAFAANLGIAVAKLVGFAVTGSSSMLAESIHSLADTGNQGLLLLGRRRASRDADEDHPFGYGRERFFWAFVVALMLFTFGSVVAIAEGIDKIVTPHHVDSPIVAIVILALAMVLEGSSMRTALAESRELRGDRTILGFIRRTKVPELPVVIMEDFGAIVGLVVALTALILAWQVDPVFDGVGTLIIGLLLGSLAVILAIEMKSLLIGEAASPDDVGLIVSAVESTPGVDRLIHLRTEHLGPEEILVAAKVGIESGLDLAQVAETIDRIEVAIRADVPGARLIYLEPDLYRGATGTPPEDH